VVNIFANELGHVGEYSPAGVADVLQERKNLMDFLPKSVDELPPRRMKDSFVTAVIPLKDRLDIRERYVTFDGNVRIGRVLEDMDIFSGISSFKLYLVINV
jgi:acyl-coenzyme A thioesterase 9